MFVFKLFVFKLFVFIYFFVFFNVTIKVTSLIVPEIVTWQNNVDKSVHK